ncbi:hypothetical protein BKA83DRAFT_3616526 [Pisolithus microcarpus]|nr:hypothetical protein BKA83DRAFT_3616526 [Pisolithus microcarpus]
MNRLPKVRRRFALVLRCIFVFTENDVVPSAGMRLELGGSHFLARYHFVSFRNPGQGSEPTIMKDKASAKKGLSSILQHCLLREGLGNLDPAWHENYWARRLADNLWSHPNPLSMTQQMLKG